MLSGLDDDDDLHIASPPPAPEAKVETKSKNNANINPSIEHSVAVDGEQVAKMSENLASNDTIMKALSALDFDSTGATMEDVEDNLSRAIEPTKFEDEIAPPPPPKVEEIDDIDDIMGSSIGGIMTAGNELEDDDDGDGEMITSDYLSSLYDDDD